MGKKRSKVIEHGSKKQNKINTPMNIGIQQKMNGYNDAHGIRPTYKGFSENPFKSVQTAVEKEKKFNYDSIFEGKETVKSRRPPPPKNPLTKMQRSVMSK